MPSLKSIVSFALTTMTLGSTAQQQVYVVNGWGDLYAVDLGTCASTLIGFTGLSVFDIAYCPVSGLLYGVTEYSELYIIDPTDASVEFVGYTDFILNALVCDELGTLYAACQYDDGIYSVDILTGSTDLIGSTCTGLVSGGDLTFYNGGLYLSSSTNELVQVDLQDPCASVVVGGFGGVGDVFGIVSVLDCSQHLYVSSGSSFYDLNMTTLGTTAQCNWIVPGGINGAASATETATAPALQSAGPYCQTDPATILQASVPGGTWTADCGNCINANGLFDPGTAESGLWTITYTHCGDPYNMEVVVQATTATLISVGPFCIADAPVQLNASTAGGTWSGPGIVDASAGMFDPGAAGVGTHGINFLPAGPCAVVATLQINVTGASGVAIQAVGPFCTEAPPVQLQASMSGGVWSGPGIVNGATGLFDPSVAGQGQHLISYGPASGSCAFGGTTMITVNPLPSLAATAYGPFCLNHGELPEPVVVADLPGTGSFVDLPAGWNSALSIGAGQHSIGYAYTADNGCSASTSITFLVNDTTAINYTLPDICSSASPMELSPLVDPAGGEFFVDYGNGSWTGPVGQFDPASVLPYPDGATAYPVRYAFTDPVGCSSLNTGSITVQPVPHPSFVTADICVNDTLTVTNTSSIGSGSIAAWAWNFSGQPVVNEAQPEPFICGVAEPLLITLVATSDQGCTATWSDTAFVHAAPVADFSTTGHCQENPVQYIDLSFMPANSLWDAIQSRQWHFGSSGTSMEPDPIVLPGLWGEFQDTLIVTSNFGCSDTAIHPITVYPVPMNSMLATDQCQQDSAVLLSLSTIPEGVIEGTWWEVEGDTLVGTAATHAFTSAGFVPITLHTVTDQGCGASLTDSVEVWPLPVVGLDLTVTGICMNDRVFVNGASSIAAPYAITVWTWTVNGAPMATGPSVELLFADAGTYAIGLTVTSANGCSATTTSDVLLVVHPLPVAGFTTDPRSSTMMNPEVRFVDTSSGASEWMYDFGDGSGSTEQHPEHGYTTHGTYSTRQIVTSEHGCLDTAYQEVVIDPEVLIHVPNAFTPDGDGVNDVFLPVLYGFDVRTYRLTVWNRWGEPIFETADEHQPWDGRAVGANDLVQDGVYVWQLDLAAQGIVERRSLTGHVTMLR